MEFKVTHVDCNGKPIQDISKVVLPLDLSIEILQMKIEQERLKATGAGQASPLT